METQGSPTARRDARRSASSGVVERVGRTTRRRPAIVAAVSVTAMLGMASCSDADSDDIVADGASDGSNGLPSDTGDVFTPAPLDSGGDASELGPVAPQPPDVVVSDSVLDPIEPVPDTGVPGIDSTDAFCRAWSEFAGSYQALTFGWAFRDPAVAATHEVVANDVLISAVDDLAASLPAELEAERSALTSELPAPLLRRADRARTLLVDAGVDAAGIETLGAAWLAAVTANGTESDTLEVEIPVEFVDQVEQASQGLLGELPPITEDPSLIVDVRFPQTEQYLFVNCPDRGTLAGNDRVD
jgi:hypothetical protein